MRLGIIGIEVPYLYFALGVICGGKLGVLSGVIFCIILYYTRVGVWVGWVGWVGWIGLCGFI